MNVARCVHLLILEYRCPSNGAKFDCCNRSRFKETFLPAGSREATLSGREYAGSSLGSSPPGSRKYTRSSPGRFCIESVHTKGNESNREVLCESTKTRKWSTQSGQLSNLLKPSTFTKEAPPQSCQEAIHRLWFGPDPKAREYIRDNSILDIDSFPEELTFLTAGSFEDVWMPADFEIGEFTAIDASSIDPLIYLPVIPKTGFLCWRKRTRNISCRKWRSS